MCNDCENDFEDLAKACAVLTVELEAKIEELENALSETLKCYKQVSETNDQLVITNAHLMKKMYYEHKHN